MCAALSAGDVRIPLLEVLPAVVGIGDAETTLVVQEFRLPRVALGVLAGVSVGVAGAVLLDPLRRVPHFALAAPAAVALQALIWPAGGFAVVVVAVAGVLAGLAALRFGEHDVLLALATQVAVSAVVALLLAPGDDPPARWLASGLEARGWEPVWWFAAAVAVLLPITLRGGPVAATGLAALAIAITGSVALLALLAAPLARRRLGDGGPAIAGAALAGVVLVLAGDLASGPGRSVAVLAAVACALAALLLVTVRLGQRRARQLELEAGGAEHHVAAGGAGEPPGQ